MPATTLDLYIANWILLLQGWSVNGRLSAAAQEALLLDGQPSLLTALIEQWSKGDFSGLPPIVLLPASSMPGAAGAYANSTGTIYINEDWLQIASQAQALSVFTQELGHHLDALLNTSVRAVVPVVVPSVFQSWLPLLSSRATKYNVLPACVNCQGSDPLIPGLISLSRRGVSI